MSNPGINRWGLNLFWYRYWYVDKNYSNVMQQDTLINLIVRTFLNFGAYSSSNVFINNYWYKKWVNRNYLNEHNTAYHRTVGFKNLISKELEYCDQRIRIENIYQSKIWILRFQHWLVVNFYCYNPIKKKKIKRKNLFEKFGADIYTKKSSYNFQNYKRIKFLLFFFYHKLNISNLYYLF